MEVIWPCSLKCKWLCCLTNESVRGPQPITEVSVGISGGWNRWKVGLEVATSTVAMSGLTSPACSGSLSERSPGDCCSCSAS